MRDQGRGELGTHRAIISDLGYVVRYADGRTKEVWVDEGGMVAVSFRLTDDLSWNILEIATLLEKKWRNMRRLVPHIPAGVGHAPLCEGYLFEQSPANGLKKKGLIKRYFLWVCEVAYEASYTNGETRTAWHSGFKFYLPKKEHKMGRSFLSIATTLRETLQDLQKQERECAKGVNYMLSDGSTGMFGYQDR